MKYSVGWLMSCALACGSEPQSHFDPGGFAVVQAPADPTVAVALPAEGSAAAGPSGPAPPEATADEPAAAGSSATTPVIEGPPAAAPALDREPSASSEPASAGESSEPAPEPDESGEPAPAGESNESSESSPDEALPAEPSGRPLVTVSFTFDDTYGEQVEAAALLEAHGLRGTFYVNSPELHRATVSSNPNAPITIAEALELQARGHDIGGHTLGHLSLTDVPGSERIREIMADRAQLVQLGIQARSFAYPYGHVEADDLTLGPAVLEIARESGYTSARDTNGFNLDTCSGLESLPPADPFILRSIRSVNEPLPGTTFLDPKDTADTLLAWIDRAASCGGGWLPLVFHHLNADCSNPADPRTYCFDFSELERLAAALESGVRCPGGDPSSCYPIQVETVSAAIGTSELAPAPEVPGLRNASLERALASGLTECVQRTFTSSNAVFSRSAIANTGQASERLELASPFEASAEIGITRDFGACSVFTTEGNAYELSVHYRAEPAATAPRLRLVTYRLTSEYAWETWELGAPFTARDPGEWVRLEATTSAVPSDTIALSFGLRLESAGAINVDDFDSVPLGPAGD